MIVGVAGMEEESERGNNVEDFSDKKKKEPGAC